MMGMRQDLLHVSVLTKQVLDIVLIKANIFKVGQNEKNFEEVAHTLESRGCQERRKGEINLS